MSKFQNFFTQLVKESHSIAEVCREMDYASQGGSYSRVHQLIKKYQLDTSHFSNEPWNKGKMVNLPKYTLNEILIKDSPIHNSNSLKKRLFSEGLKEDKCEICGNTESAELHHINGDHCDNRLENLQILCPNCHAKTDTYRGKNKSTKKKPLSPEHYILTPEQVLQHKQEQKHLKEQKEQEKILKHTYVCKQCGKSFVSRRSQSFCSVECYCTARSKNRPSYEELIVILKSLHGNFTKVAEKYGVTDNAVRKWCKLYKISDKSHDYQ